MKTTEFDHIVIGAGSAGCVVAGRLSEDPSARVLLLEAGGSNRTLAVKAPLGFSGLFHTNRDWDYWTEPEPHAGGRRLFSPRGRMLGGSSSMNAQIYIRGNRVDYDGWADGDAAGWSYDEVLPYFKRSENNAQISDDYHGQSGPLHVTRHRRLDPVSQAVAEGAAELGIPRNDDFNGRRQDGVGEFQVNQHRGMRFSSAEAFLRRRANLTVRTNALVTRIVVDGDRAVAVEVRDGRGRSERVRVTGEIVLCAGAFNTPALLQHSGIGPAELLRQVGVTPLIDLPAVGEHLMEHPMAYVTHELTVGNTGLFDAERPKHL